MYGPLAPGGVPVQKKVRPNVLSRDFQGNVVPRIQPIIEDNDVMKFKEMAAVAAMTIAATLAACDSDHDATATRAALADAFTNPSVPHDEGAPSSASASGSNGESSGTHAELIPFIEPGLQIRDVAKGDINNDNLPDVVMVVESASDKHQTRSVLLLIRDASGALHKMTQNDKIIPCSSCGGTFGDPFGYTQIANNVITFVTEGGSREHWWNEYTFKYSPELKDLVLSEVNRGVVDGVTGKKKDIRYTPKDFGLIRFEDFEPSKLPEATLP